MTRLVWAVAIATAFVGCDKKKRSATSSVADAPREGDAGAMWRHAPAGTHAGIVVAPGAGADIHRALIAVANSLRKSPAAYKPLEPLLTELARDGFDLTAVDGFAAIGIDPSKGAGLFMAGDGVYAILPVSNRATFREAIGAKEQGGVDSIYRGVHCTTAKDLYRCAPSAEKLAAWRPANQPVDAGWPDELRGSIEVLVRGELLDAELFTAAFESATALRAAVRFERGGILARFSVEGRPAPSLSIGKTPLAAAVMKRKPAALMVGYGRALVDVIKDKNAGKLDVSIPGGISPRALLEAVTGEVVAYAPAGAPSRGYVEIGINDSEPFKKLASLCGTMPPISNVSFKQTSDGCEVTLHPPQVPEPIKISIQIDDTSIVAGLGDWSAGRAGKVAVLPDYLTGPDWLVAMWLRGSPLIGLDQISLIPPQTLQRVLAASPEASLGVWAFLHLSELGAGLRTDATGIHGFFRLSTTWRNGPEVVAALEPLFAKLTGGDLSALDEVKGLAATHGGSPLSTDLELGEGGGVVGAAMIGLLAAVAVPAFMKYIKKSKTTEARQYVKRIYDGARAHYLDAPANSASFPKTSTPITPPLGTCCAQGGKCAPDPELWAHETWRQLRFSIGDPHYYSYQYEVAPDGQSFTARAHGDLDCDGEYSTFEMYGAVEGAGSAGINRQDDLE